MNLYENKIIKQLILIGSIFGASLTTFSQSKGFVYDNLSKQPIYAVNIQKKNTSIGTSTNQQGNFSTTLFHLGDTLIISHLSYIKKEVVLNQFDINISLQAAQNILAETKIYAKKKNIKLVNNPWVIDYCVVNDSTLLVAKVSNKGSVIELIGKENSRKDFLFSGINNFVVDCKGQVYVCKTDTAYCIEIVNNEIFIKSFLLNKKLKEIQHYCTLFFKERQYMSSFSKDNKLNYFFFYRLDKKTFTPFYQIFDKNTYKYLKNLQARYNYLKGHTVGIMGDIYPDAKDSSKQPGSAHEVEDLEDNIAIFKKFQTYSPLFLVENQLVVIDNINNKTIFFTDSNTIQKYTNFTSSFNKIDIKYIEQDKVTEDIYYFIKEDDQMNIYQLDIYTGQFHLINNIKPFVEKPTVYNGILYYLDYNFRKETRELYKLPL